MFIFPLLSPPFVACPQLPVRGASAPARSSVSLEVSTEDRVTLRPVIKPQWQRAVSRSTAALRDGPRGFQLLEGRSQLDKSR